MSLAITFLVTFKFYLYKQDYKLKQNYIDIKTRTNRLFPIIFYVNWTTLMLLKTHVFNDWDEAQRSLVLLYGCDI